MLETGVYYIAMGVQIPSGLGRNGLKIVRRNCVYDLYKVSYGTHKRPYLFPVLTRMCVMNIVEKNDIEIPQLRDNDDVIKWKHFPRCGPFFPSQRLVTRSFDIFFDLRLKQTVE